MEYIVFSSDGTLRAKLDDKPALPLFFLRDKSKVSEIRFMSYWFNKKAIFEEGLTVGSFLSNLQPFEKYLNEYLGKDISAYIKESRKLISIEQRKDFDWICLSHSYTICEQSEINEDKEKFLINEWKIFENYNIAAYKYEDNEQYAIEKYPIQKIQHIPLFLDSNTRIIVNDKEIQLIDNGKVLLNKKAFGVITKEIENHYQLQYLISKKDYTFRDVIEGFFKYFNVNISSREKQVEMLEDFIEEIKEDEVKLKIHQGYLEQVMNEAKEKENEWSKFVQMAAKENNLVKIGKMKESVIPESKLYGTSIEEKVEKIKIKE